VARGFSQYPSFLDEERESLFEAPNRVRNDANKDAKQAEIATAGENRRKKINLHCVNQIKVSETHQHSRGFSGGLRDRRVIQVRHQPGAVAVYTLDVQNLRAGIRPGRGQDFDRVAVLAGIDQY